MSLRTIIESIDRVSDPFWLDSKHEGWHKLNNQTKGKVGSLAYAEFLKEKEGFDSKIISDEGDLLYKASNGEEQRVEVKTSVVTLKELKRPEGFITERAWFNQIRPKQEGWTELVLVAIYPNSHKIWRIPRKRWDGMSESLQSNTLSHVGTDDLEAVSLVKNTNQNTFSELDEFLVHDDLEEGIL